MDYSKHVQCEHLGVNKMGKSIRKSPLHQPSFSNNDGRQQPQPHIYNISKNDFRNIVQQLTGSPSQKPLSRPPQNSQKPPSMRLQKIRPPPLSPIKRPQTPALVPNDSSVRPFGPFAGDSHLLAAEFPPLSCGNVFWPNSIESPISAYMRYLQTSMAGPFPGVNWGQPPLQQPIQSQNAAQVWAGNPTNPEFPPQMMNPHVAPPPPNVPSPTSQFLLPSPSFYSSLVSPLLSPGIEFSPLLSPNFSFSSLAHRPPSAGPFPLSPSGFCSFSSP